MNCQPSAQRLPGTSLVQPQRDSLRVLVVEDHEDTAASTALVLRLYGHEVHVAADGQTALHIAETIDPDVVLLDLALPKMSGWQVAQALRERAVKRRPLLVAISGYSRKADRLRSREAGIDLHLVKPIDPDQLQELLLRFRTVIVP